MPHKNDIKLQLVKIYFAFKFNSYVLEINLRVKVVATPITKEKINVNNVSCFSFWHKIP